MPRSSEETTVWVAGNIAQMKGVAGTHVTSPNTFRVIRNEFPPFEVAVFSASEATAAILDPLLTVYPHVAFAVNVPKDSRWTKSGISSAREHGVAFGGIGELMSAISHKLEDVREYKKKENEFVERGLRQHDRVTYVEQEFDRVYQIYRSGLKTLRIVLLNEYELTAEHVRTALEKYGWFDIVLMTNPNGSPTSIAEQVARGMGIQILMWRQFLGRLNSE